MDTLVNPCTIRDDYASRQTGSTVTRRSSPRPTSIDLTTINTTTSNSTDASTSEQVQLLSEQPDLGLRAQHLATNFGRLTVPNETQSEPSHS